MLPQHPSIHQNSAGPRAVCSAVALPGDSPGAAIPVPPPLRFGLVVAQVVTLQALAQVGHTAELLVVVVELVLVLPPLDPACKDSPVTPPARLRALALPGATFPGSSSGSTLPSSCLSVCLPLCAVPHVLSTLLLCPCMPCTSPSA